MSDAVDKGWTLQDKCQGGFKFAETEKENLLRLFFQLFMTIVSPPKGKNFNDSRKVVKKHHNTCFLNQVIFWGLLSHCVFNLDFALANLLLNLSVNLGLKIRRNE